MLRQPSLAATPMPALAMCAVLISAEASAWAGDWAKPGWIYTSALAAEARSF